MNIAENIAHIRAQAGPAKAIAVSKTQTVDVVRQALAVGQRMFGENRVQEAKEKFPPLRQAYPDIELHLIGALQTNKARDAVETFDVIQTVDRERLVDALVDALRKTGRKVRFYVEVNIGNEPQKAGVSPDHLGAFLDYCHDKGLAISGLMCIPPHNTDPRPHFMRMRQLADQFKLPHLSMGMSADYREAVECGATEVRVGTALFGVRKNEGKSNGDTMQEAR
jgi:pyridoxal phosphate enzyme (YggS family)